jgi:hypothetical protein
MALLYFAAVPPIDTYASGGFIMALGLHGWAGVELLRHLHVQVSVSPSDLRPRGLNQTDRLGGGVESYFARQARGVGMIGLCQCEFLDPPSQLGVAIGPDEEGISEALLPCVSG